MPTIAGYHPYKKLSENLTTVTLSGKHPATGKNVVLKLLKGEHPPNERLDRITSYNVCYTKLLRYDEDAGRVRRGAGRGREPPEAAAGAD